MRVLLYITIFCLSLNGFYAQTKEALEKEKKKISADIELTNRLLNETRSKGKVTLDQISLINNKIKLQQRLINTITSQSQKLSSEINKNQLKLKELNEEIEVLKKEYASLIELSYKTRDTYSWMMHIFASESIGEAVRRARYLQEISKLRERQSRLIEDSKKDISHKNELLKAQKLEKQSLLDTELAQKSELQKDRNAKQSVLNSIQGQEQELKKKLKRQEEKRKKLSREIEKIIAAEIKKRKKSTNKFSLTPDEEIISGNFEKNKGKLPWPVERGIITENFGAHPHPDLPGIEIVNNGIDISTDVGSGVRSLFNGEVTGVITIPGAGLAVMVKHGDYWTVYSNLASSLVEKGEKIDTKQSIGLLLEENNASKAHLEIWQYTSSGMKKLNPKHWIAE